MLAVTLVTGVIAVGVSVAVMSSETTEKAKTKADIKYLEAKAPYNFGKDKASVDNFKKLRDDRLIAALRDPRVDLQFVKDLSDDQIANMVKYAGTADAILSMPETQRLSLVDIISKMLAGANPKVVATVLSIAPRTSMTNDDGINWSEVLRQLLEVYPRAQPDVRSNVHNQIEAILKSDPELTDVPRTFVDYGGSFLPGIRHGALAHVLHAFTDGTVIAKLYQTQAMRDFDVDDVEVVKRKLGSAQNERVADLLRRVITDKRMKTPIEEVRVFVDQTQIPTGYITVDVPGGPYAPDQNVVIIGKTNAKHITWTYSRTMTIELVEVKRAYDYMERVRPRAERANAEMARIEDALRRAHQNLTAAKGLASDANNKFQRAEDKVKSPPTDSLTQAVATAVSHFNEAVRRERAAHKVYIDMNTAPNRALPEDDPVRRNLERARDEHQQAENDKREAEERKKTAEEALKHPRASDEIRRLRDEAATEYNRLKHLEEIADADYRRLGEDKNALNSEAAKHIKEYDAAVTIHKNELDEVLKEELPKIDLRRPGGFGAFTVVPVRILGLRR